MSNMSILSIMMCIIITLETLPTKLLRPVLSSTHLVSFKNICEEDFTKQATKQSSVYRFIFHHPPLLSRLLKVDDVGEVGQARGALLAVPAPVGILTKGDRGYKGSKHLKHSRRWISWWSEGRR